MGLLGDTMDAFKRGASGDETGVYERAGRPVTCSHCGGTSFDKGSALLNSRGLTFFDLDWANASADTYICKACGHIEWFVEL